MKGFDPKYRDPAEFIIGVTKAIWEDRGVATLHHHYAPSIIVRSPASIVIGNGDVISATLATLAEFPDRQLLAEDVIWCDDGGDGFLSSHRLICTATHLGDGAYGAASGRSLRYRIIADCHAAANCIDDEWLVRDQGAILRGLGIDPQRFAADQIAREGGPEACIRPFTPEQDRAGPYQGIGNASDWGARYGAILSRIMEADLAVIPAEYDRAYKGAFPGGVEGVSHQAADRFWIGLRSAFPSARFRIHHQIGRDDPLWPPRAALRWSLTGRHDGWGMFGQPTGAEVHVMGISHAEFGPWGLRREWVAMDETAIWKQIILATG